MSKARLTGFKEEGDYLQAEYPDRSFATVRIGDGVNAGPQREPCLDLSHPWGVQVIRDSLDRGTDFVFGQNVHSHTTMRMYFYAFSKWSYRILSNPL